jgi:hypothetical protein
MFTVKYEMNTYIYEGGSNTSTVFLRVLRGGQGDPVRGGLTGPIFSGGNINTGTWPIRLGESQTSVKYHTSWCRAALWGP